MIKREIKFRAWDSENKDMVYWEDIENGLIDPYTLFWNCPDWIELMQYTGLKDKNGREIYEGDILSDRAVVEWFDELAWDGLGSPHSGFYCEQWFDYGENGQLNYHYGFFNNVEVIGNIYENPELL